MSEGNQSSEGRGNRPAYVQDAPTMGRTVHIFDASSSRREAAIITRVHGPGCVNVHVLPDCAAPYYETSVLEIDSDNVQAHGWFWPPRV